MKQLGLGTIPLTRRRKVYNIDGTENRAGEVTDYCVLNVLKGKQEAAQIFFLTNLGDDSLVLGYPWLAEFNPTIDWTNGTMERPPVRIMTTGRSWKLIWAAGRSTAKKASISQQMAEKQGKDQQEQAIPQEYQRHIMVFSEEAAKRFPPERPEDHVITLTSDAPKSINCKMYKLTQEEEEAARSMTDQQEQLGYVTRSNSAWSSPLFFIKKKDGRLRPVFDYREVNKWTVKDVYPLPRMDIIFDQLKDAKLLSKFDIRDGYYNIRIHPESRWITAVKTPGGLYQCNVMPFGLCNAPATFQKMMDRIMAPLKAKYPRMVHWYMDDVLIATPNDQLLHQQITHEFLDILEKESLFLKPEKCRFEQTNVEFLGYLIDEGTIKIDPTKRHGLSTWPRTLRNVKDVRSTLGVLGYQRQFIPGFARIARPLTDLLKKGTTFTWTEECSKAVDTLIQLVTSDPVLQRPDLTKPFTLEVDASQYATGAILQQEDDQGTLRPVGYYSKTMNPAERNYDVHDRELTAVMRGLRHWRHLLLSSPHKITIISDHANLQYFREAHKINRRVARNLTEMTEYNFQIVHKPGKSNKADLLSRPPGTDQGKGDHDQVVVLPDHLFVRLLATQSHLEEEIVRSQQQQQELMEQWVKEEGVEREGSEYYKDARLVVPMGELRREVLKACHDHQLAGHPGIVRTLATVTRSYWWPGVRDFVTKYVQGCGTCQSTKSGTTRPSIPLFPIGPKTGAAPFETIALDLITDLPGSQGYDSILTITDHDCSKAALFIPCNKTIDGPGVARLYAEKVFPHYGLPKRVISDRDPRFTSIWTKELCRQLGIYQNISTAYHPQTDGQSERTNQWLEQYLRIYGNFQQDDWVAWLPMAQFTHNTWINETTKQTPFELLMGHTPTLKQQKEPGRVLAIEERKKMLIHGREKAQEAIKKAQELLLKRNQRKKGRKAYEPFKEGDKVWLDGKNLHTSHPLAKLAPKRFGPFRVEQVVNPIVFRLKLPPQWEAKRIHPVFHASLLSPYKETEEHGKNFEEPPPDVIDGEEEYEVEQVLDVRRQGRQKQLQYLLKWKGYSEAHNSWEPADQVNAPELIADFQQRIKARGSRRGGGTTIMNPERPGSPSIPIPIRLRSVHVDALHEERVIQGLSRVDTRGDVLLVVPTRTETESYLGTPLKPRPRSPQKAQGHRHTTTPSGEEEASLQEGENRRSGSPPETEEPELQYPQPNPGRVNSKVGSESEESSGDESLGGDELGDFYGPFEGKRRIYKGYAPIGIGLLRAAPDLHPDRIHWCEYCCEWTDHEGVLCPAPHLLCKPFYNECVVPRWHLGMDLTQNKAFMSREALRVTHVRQKQFALLEYWKRHEGWESTGREEVTSTETYQVVVQDYQASLARRKTAEDEAARAQAGGTAS